MPASILESVMDSMNINNSLLAKVLKNQEWAEFLVSESGLSTEQLLAFEALPTEEKNKASQCFNLLNQEYGSPLETYDDQDKTFQPMDIITIYELDGIFSVIWLESGDIEIFETKSEALSYGENSAKSYINSIKDCPP